MFNLLVNSEGGLTVAGYAVSIVAAVIIFLIAAFLAGKFTSRKSMSAKQLAFCAMALALGFVTSYIKFLPLPFGGSVTAFSMLFIVLVGYWYGPKTGILVGLTYGIMEFLQEPYVLSLFQVCCDYFLAFAALGISGFFAKSKNGLLKGYILAVLARGVFHTLGGYLYWMDYMPEDFPQSLAVAYPIIYNYSYLLAEGFLTVILISLPPVKKALEQVKNLA
ncbi:MAG: ECF transporter S component [Clostridia bacterium]|nr:ECF transporter S component [Clostridia bacterium]